MRWLVLVDDLDAGARWAFERLSVAIEAPGAMITAGELTLARSDYRTGNRNAAVVRLPRGEVLDAREIGWALNRLSSPPAGAVAHLGADAPYAQAEWHALLLSRLHELGDGAVNAPEAPSLSGPLLAHVHGLGLAGRAGYGLPALALSTHGVSAPAARHAADIRIVADGFVGRGPVHNGAVQSACRLAQLAGATLLHTSLTDDCRFLTGDPSPDLRAAGEDVIALLAAHARAHLR